MMATGNAMSITISRERNLCLPMSRTARRLMRRRWGRPRAIASPERRTALVGISGVVRADITTGHVSGCR